MTKIIIDYCSLHVDYIFYKKKIKNLKIFQQNNHLCVILECSFFLDYFL